MSRYLPLLAWLGSIASGCVVLPGPDYATYRAHMPRSILVVPPLNETTDVNAPYTWLSTVTRPLVESGYYVFPVAVVDAFLKENGLPTPGEMNAVPPAKFHEILGADAVLFVVIEQWGQKYQIVASTTVVEARARLVEAATGQQLWEGTAMATESSNAGQGDPIAMLIGAIIEQIVDSFDDRTHDVARQANFEVFLNPNTGLLRGPYHPDFGTDPRGR